jgi:hypothetical protein
MTKLISLIENLLDKMYMLIAIRAYKRGDFVDAEDTFRRLGL